MDDLIVGTAKFEAWMDGDGSMAPEPLDDLVALREHACATAKRALEYVARIDALLALTAERQGEEDQEKR